MSTSYNGNLLAICHTNCLFIAWACAASIIKLVANQPLKCDTMSLMHIPGYITTQVTTVLQGLVMFLWAMGTPAPRSRIGHSNSFIGYLKCMWWVGGQDCVTTTK